MNLCEAVKAANGGRIYRKATGIVVLFQSGAFERKNVSCAVFPTLEDARADDWYPVRAGSVRDKVRLF